MADRTAAPSPLLTSPLVGRERERARLRDALAAALAGRGSLVLFGGEAGIGKTALAEALLAEASEQGALVLVGRCYDLSETPPYGPWAEAFARAPHGGRLSAPPLGLIGITSARVESQSAIFAAMRDYLATLAATSPLVLLLDDLHWADPASLDLLRIVSRQLVDVPLLLLATFREDELTLRHPLSQLLPLMVREAHAIRLDLRRLEADELRTLVRMRYGLPPGDEDRLVAHLAERSEGNCFFAGELLRSLEERRVLRQGGHAWTLGDFAAMALPPLLRQVLNARIDRLGEKARELLTMAAIIGQEVPLALWASVAGTDEDGLLDSIERAVAARLLEALPAGDAVRFAHALIREALYDGTLAPRRRQLHRRAGEVLAASAAADPDAVAYHFQRAGDARAGAWLVKAGERAERAYAWVSAAGRYEAALALLAASGADPGERGWLLLQAAALLRFIDTVRGLAHLEAALTLANAAGDRALVAAILNRRGMMRCSALDFHGGLADLAAGVAAWETLPDPQELARAKPSLHLGRSQYALWLALNGRYAGGLAEAERALADLADTGSQAFADAAQARGYALAGLGHPEAALRALGEARAAYQAVGHYALVTETATNELEYALLPYGADQLAVRERLMATAAEAWAKTGGMTHALSPHFERRALLLHEGRWDEAAALGEALRALTATPMFRLVGTVPLARLARERGDAPLSRRLLLDALPGGAGSTPGDIHLPFGLALLRLGVELALDSSDLPGARTWLEAYQRWLDWSGAVRGRAEGQLGWSLYHRAAGNPVLARQHAVLALADACDPRQPLALLAANRALGELDTAAGHHASAQAHLGAALALAEACAAPYERALTLLATAELRVAASKPTDAASPLAEAHATFADLGAAPALARADALVDRLVAPASVRDASPFGLTPREAEALCLVAQGLANAEIAARLHVSHRTIEQHLRSVYGKLGVENRTAATRLAIAHGLAGDVP